MIARPSYTRIQHSDRIAQSIVLSWQTAALVVALALGGGILARATLSTLAATPTLTDPAMVPGCC